MTVAQPLPPPQNGDEREDRAILIAAAVTAIFAAAEAALAASIAAAVRRALAAAVTILGGRGRQQITPAVSPEAIGQRLERQAAAILAVAEQRAGREVTSALGEVPQDVTDALQAASSRALESTGDIYRQAIDAALAEVRGGLPYSSVSLSRIQAAQKALDDLLGKGITGFTDRTGRNWDLASYVEMATRTAVSNAYMDHLTRGLVAGGVDLALVGTHSTEGSCPHCLPYQGRLLSLTGATTGPSSITDVDGTVHRAVVFTTLEDAKRHGLFHPNCRCDLIGWHNGTNLATAEMYATSPAKSAAEYKASQRTRALERRVRAAGRRQQAAITPQARTKARRDLAAARAASAAHRAQHGVRQTKVGVRRREHPYRAH